ncbi:MAG TPA: 23S rRNA (uracil(1939)-C(5))-methyltransferase RlmD [Pseudomonadales bacterium]|nr:23S rRNA (uracil(1939)-C(5))-methyltransferase RlmD [Pseudomonadales bacterium]
MSRNRNLPDGSRVPVERLDADGLGIGTADGFSLRIHGALPGEHTMVRVVRKRRRRLEAVAEVVSAPNPDRVTPECPYAGRCGGCALQHLAPDAQRARKRARLGELFAAAGVPAPDRWLPDVVGPTRGYRRKARIGARRVDALDSVLVGFRERGSSRVAEVESCRVLSPEIGERIGTLRDLLSSLAAAAVIPQVEIAVGDDGTALVLRHLEALGEADLALLVAAAARENWQLYLQPGGTETTHRIWPTAGPELLHYRLPEFGLEFAFHPQEFTQINVAINRQMVPLALELLAPGPEDRVLDLFCGLGNFTLPLAGRCAFVHGVEGSEALVERARGNAAANGIDNVDFAAADLYARDFDVASLPRCERLLLDPPRSGAERICREIAKLAPERIVYVSCRPDTLARDARALLDAGYRMAAAGILDMFPHTAHVESLAVFDAP